MIYALGLGVSGILSVVMVSIYTRLLSPQEYGRYTLVMAGVSLASVVMYEWIRSAVVRLFPQYLQKKTVLISTVLFTLLALCFVAGVFGLMLAIVWRDSGWSGLVITGVVMVWTQFFYDFGLDLARSHLMPLKYAAIYTTRSVIALLVGWILALCGAGSYAPLIGLITGMGLSSLLMSKQQWRLSGYDSRLLTHMLRYGLPISMIAIMNFVTSLSDRFILSFYHGEKAVGIYAAGYDMCQKALALFISVVNMGSYPIVVRTYELEGIERTRLQLHHVAVLLVGISLPIVAAVGLLASSLVNLFLGSSFRTGTDVIITWVMLGLFWGVLRSYYFDLPFQLRQSTLMLLWPTAIGALANVVLNLLLIPSRGAIGAAQATFFSYLLSCFGSVLMGRRLFPLPLPTIDWLKLLLSTCGMSAVLWMGVQKSDIMSVVGYTALGVLVYVGLAGMLDVGGYRSRLIRRLAE